MKLLNHFILSCIGVFVCDFNWMNVAWKVCLDDTLETVLYYLQGVILIPGF